MLNRSTLIQATLVAAAGAMFATAYPAMASEKGGATIATTSQASEPSSKKICLSPTVSGEPLVTGSILAKRECRTRAQWEAKGVKFQSK